MDSSKSTENYWLVVSKQDSGNKQGMLLQSHELAVWWVKRIRQWGSRSRSRLCQRRTNFMQKSRSVEWHGVTSNSEPLLRNLSSSTWCPYIQMPTYTPGTLEIISLSMSDHEKWMTYCENWPTDRFSGFCLSALAKQPSATQDTLPPLFYPVILPLLTVFHGMISLPWMNEERSNLSQPTQAPPQFSLIFFFFFWTVGRITTGNVPQCALCKPHLVPNPLTHS